MWQVVAQVTTGFALAAFIAAAIAWVIRVKAQERERLIRTAQPEERADLVRNALEFFHVDTPRLTKEQQYLIAIEQIQARADRFSTIAKVVCFLAVISAALAAYAIYGVSRGIPSASPSSEARATSAPPSIAADSSPRDQPATSGPRSQRPQPPPIADRMKEGVGSVRLELPAEQDSYAVEVLGTAVLALTSTTGPTVRMFLNNEITPCNSASLPASSPTGFVEIQALACSFALSAGEKALVRLEAIGGAPQYSRLKARYDSP